MSRETTTLRELYLDVTDGETITELQEKGPSYDPLGESEMELNRQWLMPLNKMDSLTPLSETRPPLNSEPLLFSKRHHPIA